MKEKGGAVAAAAVTGSECGSHFGALHPLANWHIGMKVARMLRRGQRRRRQPHQERNIALRRERLERD